MKLNQVMIMSCLLAGLTLSACTHLSGVVLDERNKRPVPSAVFSIGRPTGLGSFQTFNVDKDGKFDFYISPTDDPYVYVYDGKGDPNQTIQHIDRTQLRENMTVYMIPSPNAILER